MLIGDDNTIINVYYRIMLSSHTLGGSFIIANILYKSEFVDSLF